MLGVMLAEHRGPEPDWVTRQREVQRRLLALRPRFERCGPLPSRARVRIVVGESGAIIRAGYPTIPEELRPCWDRAVRTLSFSPAHLGQHQVTLDLR